MNKAHPSYEPGLLAKVLHCASSMAKEHRHTPTQERIALSELAAFCQLDPCLAALHKEFLNAKEARLRCVTQHGIDDPLTEMAIYVEDASWCSLQTRYMELRADRGLMRQVQAMMEEDRIARADVEESKNRRLAFVRWMMIEQDRKDHKAYEAQNLACFMLMVALFWNDVFKPSFVSAPVFNQRAA